MNSSSLVLYEQDHQRLSIALEKLRDDANARFVMLLDGTGLQVGATGDLGAIDATSVASLAAGNVAATSQLAQLVGEPRFSNLLHEGEQASLYLSVVAQKMILLVGFDQQSSRGLVRLRVEQHGGDLGALLEQLTQRKREPVTAGPAFASAVSEITDEDIDALFD